MLRLASGDLQTPMPLSEIAAKEELSQKYLQQLLAELRRAGLVRVVKGAKGGFMLTRTPTQVTVGEILRALEGDLGLVACVHCETVCPRTPVCKTRNLWTKATQLLENYFDSVTLADLRDGKT